MPPLHEQLRTALPRLTANNYRITSPGTWEYNCIAWAMSVQDEWWWPVAGRYWPEGAPRQETIPAFVETFALLGFAPCDSTIVETGIEKIALYALPEGRRTPPGN